MPSSQAFAAVGAQLAVGASGGGAGGSYTDIPEIIDIDGPSLSTDFIDVTNLSSPGAHKEFIPSLHDPGEVRLTANWVPQHASQSPVSGFLADKNNRTKRWYRISWPDTGTTVVEFEAYVQDYSTSTRTGDKCSANMTLKITGPLTWTL